MMIATFSASERLGSTSIGFTLLKESLKSCHLDPEPVSSIETAEPFEGMVIGS